MGASRDSEEELQTDSLNIHSVTGESEKIDERVAGETLPR